MIQQMIQHSSATRNQERIKGLYPLLQKLRKHMDSRRNFLTSHYMGYSSLLAEEEYHGEQGLC